MSPPRCSWPRWCCCWSSTMCASGAFRRCTPERRARVPLRRGDADSAQRAFHSVEAHRVLLAGGGWRSSEASGSASRRSRNACWAPRSRRNGRAATRVAPGNAAWVVFDVLLGALNLLVAFNASERTWVNFKVIRPDHPDVRVRRRRRSLADPAGRRRAEPLERGPDMTEMREQLRSALEKELSPLSLEIVDDSAQHAGHAGAREGGHFTIELVSRRIYRASATRAPPAGLCSSRSTMGRGMHALSIRAHSPEEIS